MKPSRAQQKKDTRAALLEAARLVLREQGLEHATTRKIAQRAKVATGTFFVHFADVAALVEALLDEHLGVALARAFATLPVGGVVAELVHVSQELYRSYAVDPALSRAAVQASLFEGRPGSPSQLRLQGYQAWVVERLGAAMTRGEVRPIDPTLAFSAFFSLYFGLLVAGLRGQVTAAQQGQLLRAALTRLLLLEEA